jgi:hypothetical protein
LTLDEASVVNKDEETKRDCSMDGLEGGIESFQHVLGDALRGGLQASVEGTQIKIEEENRHRLAEHNCCFFMGEFDRSKCKQSAAASPQNSQCDMRRRICWETIATGNDKTEEE